MASLVVYHVCLLFAFLFHLVCFIMRFDLDVKALYKCTVVYVQHKLKLGVGFNAKARASAYFTKLGWRSGCIFVGGMCVRGWIYMFIWFGCLRRVGMYWEGGRRETTPLYHIC